jgi:hypothetical protein
MKVVPQDNVLVLQIESPYETAFLAHHLKLIKKQDMAVAVFDGDWIQIRQTLTTDEWAQTAEQNQILVEYINSMHGILSFGPSTDKIFETLRTRTADAIEKLKKIPVKDK